MPTEGLTFLRLREETLEERQAAMKHKVPTEFKVLPPTVHISELLTAFEACPRKAFWAKQWDRHRMTASRMVHKAVMRSMVVKIAGKYAPPSGDFGTHAGEAIMEMATNRGLEVVDRTGQGIFAETHVFATVLDHAAIADIVTIAIRKPGEDPWRHEYHPDGGDWNKAGYLDPKGTHLRRFIPVSSWSTERARYETRSWAGLGEVCRWKMPMQMVVAVLGPMKNGRRQGHWSRALMHANNKRIRFKLRTASSVKTFKESWIRVRREEHAEISRGRWLHDMLEDDVMQESLFVVDIPVPGEIEAQAIRDLQARQLDKVMRLSTLPEKQMSTCGGPLAPCQFLPCCWGTPEAGPEAGGFDALKTRLLRERTLPGQNGTIPPIDPRDSSNPEQAEA